MQIFNEILNQRLYFKKMHFIAEIKTFFIIIFYIVKMICKQMKTSEATNGLFYGIKIYHS